MYDDELIRPYYEHSVDVLDVSLFDVHTHTGSNDPDGFSCTADTLIGELAAVGSQAVVMPMHVHGRRPRRARARRGRQGVERGARGSHGHRVGNSARPGGVDAGTE